MDNSDHNNTGGGAKDYTNDPCKHPWFVEKPPVGTYREWSAKDGWKEEVFDVGQGPPPLQGDPDPMYQQDTLDGGGYIAGMGQ